jgi:hypothetical protein
MPQDLQARESSQADATPSAPKGVVAPAAETSAASPKKRGGRAGKSLGTALTAASTLLNRGSSSLMFLVTTPITFSALGETMFGIFQFTQRLSQFGGLTNLGAGSFLKIRLSELSDQDSREEKRKAVGECLMQWGMLSPLLLVWTIVSVFIIKGRATLTFSEIAAVTALVVITPVSQAIGLGQVALFAEGLGYRGALAGTTVNVATGLLTAAAAHFGFGIEGMTVVIGVGMLANAAVGAWIAKRSMPWFGIAWPSWAEVRGHLGHSLGAALASLTYLGLQQTETMSFALGLGPVHLSRLIMTAIFVQCLEFAVRAIVNPTSYMLAPLIRARALERLGRLHAEIVGNIALIYALAAPFIIVGTPVALAIWVPKAISLGPWVCAACLLTSFYRVQAQMDGLILDQGRSFYIKSAYAVGAVFLVCGVVVLAKLPTHFAYWYWVIPASMATYHVLIAKLCQRHIGLPTNFTGSLAVTGVGLASAAAAAYLATAPLLVRALGLTGLMAATLAVLFAVPDTRASFGRLFARGFRVFHQARGKPAAMAPAALREE